MVTFGRTELAYVEDTPSLSDHRRGRDSLDSATDPESNLIHHQLSLFSRSRIRRVSVRIGTVSESLRGRSCKDSLPSKACLAVALFLGFVPTTSMFVVGRLLPGQWVSQNGMTYLSSLGIASMLLMVLIPYLTLATLLEQMAQIQNKEAEAIKKLEPQIPDVKAVFGQDEPVVALSGHLRVCRICARAVLNIFLFSYSLADLPARNPREPLNQTKHVLAWLEFFGIWAITALFLLKPAVVEIARFLELPVFALFRAHLIRALANFSALALLRMANPQVCLDRIARASKSGAAVLLAEVVSSLFGASLGVAALVSKISTTAFIADTLFWDWEMIQWLTLVGLLNNLAGLIQIEELRLETAARLYCDSRLGSASDRSGQRVGRIFQHALQRKLKGAYHAKDAGWFWLSMNFEDVMKLTQHQNETE